MDPVFATYIERVRKQDIASILASFVEQGYVREPSGERWKHAGPVDRATFYNHLKGAPSTHFDLMTCLVDGDHVGVEYGFRYGDAPLVGGICIMERRGEQLVAVRITDDVDA